MPVFLKFQNYPVINVTVNINVLEKEETKCKIVEWAEIIKIRSEINKIKT